MKKLLSADLHSAKLAMSGPCTKMEAVYLDYTQYSWHATAGTSAMDDLLAGRSHFSTETNLAKVLLVELVVTGTRKVVAVTCAD